MLNFMKIFFNRYLAGLVFLLVLTLSVYAGDKAPVELKLVPGGVKGDHVLAGLLITIPQHWHVYAPTPSQEETAGFEPTITWETSSNLQNAKVLWPVPHRTEIQGQTSYIYEGQVLIPLQLTPHHIKDPLSLNLKISLLACSALCVPIEETLSIILSPNEKEDQVFNAAKDWEKSYEGLSLLSLLLIALLGGLILNFMPCVLPVLSLKIMSLVKQSKKPISVKQNKAFLLLGLEYCLPLSSLLFLQLS